MLKATIYANYSAPITALGGIPSSTGTYKWTVANGQLPPGLALNATTGELSGTATTAATSVQYSSGLYWNISGSMQTTGIQLDPIFSETTIGTTSQGQGTYSIEEKDATGEILYIRYFTPQVADTDNEGLDLITYPIFSEWIPVIPRTKTIVILDSTGTTLTSVSISGAQSRVAFSSPSSGFIGSGEKTLTWQVTSATASSFTSKLFYSIDNGKTWRLVGETTATSEAVDFSTLPGATAALLRVDVTDGINTGSATSIPFEVPKKAPSAIVIHTPANGAIQPAANPIHLSGAAYSVDDAFLTGKSLVWTDSEAGELGTGSPLSLKLAPGSHNITLTAIDASGNEIHATTKITLAGNAPTLNLATSQAGTACYSSTIAADPGALGAALTQVSYSLNGGATYIQIPLKSLPYTLAIPGTGTVNVVALAVDASGQTSAQSSELSLAAGCVATPELAPSGGTYTSAQTVTITDTTRNAVLHFTTDGTQPTAYSATYAGPISISKTTTVRAVAVLGGADLSPTVSATFTLKE